MSLHLRFASPQLRDLCERRAAAEKLLGELAARKLRARLADLRAATDIRQVLLGRPMFGARGRITFTLSATRRLVLAPGVSPIPRLADKKVDWAQIDTFDVVEIC
jgi:proteic killer suppression protein